MGCIPPPMALSKEEFDKRIAAGAKTLEEIDPEFCQWLRERERFHVFQLAVVVAALVVFLVTVVVVVLK